MKPMDGKNTDENREERQVPAPENKSEDNEVKNPSGSMAYNYLYRDDYGYLDD